MGVTERKRATLLLEDGTVFYGKSVGLEGTATGEICFNTGMTGYQEIFTDPSYLEQLMVMTNAHVGNYGIHPDEVESESIKISGLVVKNFSQYASRAGDVKSLKQYFEENKKIAISDIDTRALVRHIRDKGTMNAVISTELESLDDLKGALAQVPDMEGLELSSRVSTKEPFFLGDPNAPLKVAALDLGIKKNILRCLAERNVYIKVFPWNTSFETMKEWNPDGFFLSNGPGDPSAMSDVIEQVKKIVESGMPTFGICLGHQMIALASGLSTYKMHNGHRGINHPVKNLETGKGEITSQNHGFVVKREDVESSSIVELTHEHLNDQTVAGIKRTDKPCFSVQYHPESAPGPHDSRYLFDQFIQLMNDHK